MSAVAQISGGEHFEDGTVVSPMIGGGFDQKAAKAGVKKLEADVTTAPPKDTTTFNFAVEAADQFGDNAAQLAGSEVESGVRGVQSLAGKASQYMAVGGMMLINNSLYGDDRDRPANSDTKATVWDNPDMDPQAQSNAPALPAYLLSATQLGKNLRSSQQANIALEFTLHEETMEKVEGQQISVGSFYGSAGLEHVPNEHGMQLSSLSFGDVPRNREMALGA